MISCPHCDRKINAQAVTCPYCNHPLKAFGHPGIPLYQAKDRSYLCDRCRYHQDDSCTYPQRPYAKICILFHDIDQPVIIQKPVYQPYSFTLAGIKAWGYRYRAWLAIAAILIFSLILALLGLRSR